MIQESFLHFVWQNQYFNKSDLKTQSGDSVSILKTGFSNNLAGPDFKEAEIIINNVRWAGTVEIHIKSSDWYSHGHESDPNYDNVILHVVYEHDKEVTDKYGNALPTIELKGLIKPKLLKRYEAIVSSDAVIPCSDSLQKTKVITRLSMLERALMDRLERKSEDVMKLLAKNNNDWEETAYQWLAQGFGFKTNAKQMLDLAKSVPFRFLRKHDKLFQIEALLFGASGLLNIDVKDDYPKKLKEEYQFLRSKYSIKEKLTYNQWHFSGVRPTNYPTIRIAQLADLLQKHQNVFTLFTEFQESAVLTNQLNIRQSDYWNNHVIIDKIGKLTVGPLTKSAKYNLLINSTAPLLVAWGRDQDRTEPIDKALNLLMRLPKEENKITRLWKALGWNVSSAFDSQGLIGLHNDFCTKKRCINCLIGVELVKA